MGWALNPMTGDLIRPGEDRETNREESYVKTEAEIGPE